MDNLEKDALKSSSNEDGDDPEKGKNDKKNKNKKEE